MTNITVSQSLFYCTSPLLGKPKKEKNTDAFDESLTKIFHKKNQSHHIRKSHAFRGSTQKIDVAILGEIAIWNIG
jgi:hypothetical protein